MVNTGNTKANSFGMRNANQSMGMNNKKKEMMEMEHNLELAQAYVPFQHLDVSELFSPEQALIAGTVSPQLYRPYVPHQHAHSC